LCSGISFIAFRALRSDISLRPLRPDLLVLYALLQLVQLFSGDEIAVIPCSRCICHLCASLSANLGFTYYPRADEARFFDRGRYPPADTVITAMPSRYSAHSFMPMMAYMSPVARL